MANRQLHIIGELINNSYARARNAFTARDPQGYAELARIQADLGVRYLTLNLDGTARLSVKMDEMLALLPEVIPAVQAASDVPISFDNPSVEYHKVALKLYDRERSGRPILNSIAASRTHIDEMIELVKEYDTNVVVMASEHFVAVGTSQCLAPED
jgi:5-methyltetrahydrofolate--homocysteine methyltransferase